ncbi:MAG TPA: four-carbon acid sugar kinase family protein [Roseiflexaceae bacterium]|nr:four-carbon acid sugar kinase family protein [Roseiflexaceae bacterium]
MIRLLSETLASLPPDWPEDPLPAIQRRVEQGARAVVVLDDDPTGTQTVYGVPVLTVWDEGTIAGELRRGGPACYILTNSRSMPSAAAQAVSAAIGANLRVAVQAAGREVTVISRSDSTLRGHFPVETDALAAALGGERPTLLVPAFLDGGRYTIDDVHYVAEGERLVPAGETAYARDAAFGYRASNLRAWVEEKTGGRVPAGGVASISIDDIRRGGPERVAARLRAVPPGGVCIANAASERDLAVIALGVLALEDEGRPLMLRTAASFVAARLGLRRRPPLTAAELALPPGGGLVVAGSYVPSTTAQLEVLLAQPGVAGVELDVAALCDPARRAESVAAAAARAREVLDTGADVALYTSRALLSSPAPEESLAIGRSVSEGLVAAVAAIGRRPRYLLAKGGITSSDVATAALGVRRAEVLGQIIPGVPVWRLGPESRLPGLAYIVFPGNVGGPRALADVVGALSVMRRVGGV